MNRILLGDHHVHSTFSDDAVSTPEENILAAAAAGLEELRLVDHVRASTSWLPEFVTTMAALHRPEGLTVLTGVEAKILDVAGHLDLPPLPAGIERILIADHQFPAAEGPLSPREVTARMAAGWSRDDVLDTLVEAIIASIRRHPGHQLAHCFSLLPKIGLAESDLGVERLEAFTSAVVETQTAVEVNEKWACPSPGVLRALTAAGADLLASTDSHDAEGIGRYDRVADLLEEAGA